MIVLPHILGKEGLINSFLSNPIFRYLGRISFCGYLVHLFVIVRNYYSMYNIEIFTFENFLNYFIIDATFTILLGSLLCLFVEIPFANIDTEFISKRNQK